MENNNGNNPIGTPSNNATIQSCEKKVSRTMWTSLGVGTLLGLVVMQFITILTNRN